MYIRVHKYPEGKITVHPSEPLTAQVANFLIERGDNVSSVIHEATSHGVGIGNISMKHTGYIECTIGDGTIQELVNSLAEKFNLRVISSSEDYWSLVMPHEVDEY